MKKLSLMLALSILLCVLSSCNNTSVTDGTQAPKQTQDSTESLSNDMMGTNIPEETDAPEETDENFTSAENPGSFETNEHLDAFEDEILQTYHSASLAASWFRITNLLNYEENQVNPDTSDCVIVDNYPYEYYRISQFDTYAAFIDYLGNLFSESLIDELMACDMYIEHDGYLYGRFSIRGTNIFMGKESYSIEKLSESHYDLYVKVEVFGKDMKFSGNYKTFVFPYENLNEKWVFTEFPGIR